MERVIKSLALAAGLSEEARLALLDANLNGFRWVLSCPAISATEELRALKLAGELRGEAHLTISGMNVRAVVARSSSRRGAVSD
jgi:hypothetical protein